MLGSLITITEEDSLLFTHVKGKTCTHYNIKRLHYEDTFGRPPVFSTKVIWIPLGQTMKSIFSDSVLSESIITNAHNNKDWKAIESKTGLYWFCLTTISDWSRNIILPRNQSDANLERRISIFPRPSQFKYVYVEFLLVIFMLFSSFLDRRFDYIDSDLRPSSKIRSNT